MLAGQVQRIEARNMPILSYLQLIGGALTVIVVSFSAMFWAVAAFRPEASPETFQLMTDTGWLCIDFMELRRAPNPWPASSAAGCCSPSC